MLYTRSHLREFRDFIRELEGPNSRWRLTGTDSKLSIIFENWDDAWGFILTLGQQDNELVETSPTSIEMSYVDRSVTFYWLSAPQRF